jgi:glucan biosynthesis protein C
VSATVVPGLGRAATVRRRDLSIDYLRTTLTLMVLAHHSSLAYTSWAYFDPKHTSRSTAPVVDPMRWAFFDYAENFNDVFFMSLMFCVSGLFVYGAVRRHGVAGFARDRMLRLGAPFAFAVLVLMPIAYYASWLLAGHRSGFADFYGTLARNGFAAGPPWFIWVLLAFDLVIALLLGPARSWAARASGGLDWLKDYPFVAYSGMFVLSTAVYLPLLAGYGFGTWTTLGRTPLAFQVARIGLYALWFLFGVVLGAEGLEDGLLSREGGLARRWPVWIGGCIVAYNALWFIPRWVVHTANGQVGALEAVLWVASCVASCFGFLALFRGVEWKPQGWMTSLSRSAYIMYLVHYVFVLWIQKLLLGVGIHAGLKFGVVFLGTVMLSWLTAQALLRVPSLKAIL